jgi:hypothetical protein
MSATDPPTRARRVLPSMSPQDRRSRLRPDAECAVLVDVGALGGDAADGVTIALDKSFRSRLTVPEGVLARS